MRYQSKSSIAYLFRNFWHLAPIALCAAVLFGFFDNTSVQINFIRGYLDGSVNGENILTSILQTVSVLRFGKYWWGEIVAVVVLVLTQSLLMVKVSQHMRIGKIDFLPIKRAFSVVPSMFLFILCVAAFAEVLNMIVVGIAFLLHAANEILLIVLTSVLLYLAQTLASFAVGMLLFAFPIMFLENYSFNLALSYSVRLMNEKRKKLFLCATMYPFIRFALTVVCGVINIPAVTVALFAVEYLFCIAWLPCVTFKLYYDSVGGERRDIARVMFG